VHCGCNSRDDDEELNALAAAHGNAAKMVTFSADEPALHAALSYHSPVEA
jgi:hypothetical protein